MHAFHDDFCISFEGGSAFVFGVSGDQESEYSPDLAFAIVSEISGCFKLYHSVWVGLSIEVNLTKENSKVFQPADFIPFEEVSTALICVHKKRKI